MKELVGLGRDSTSKKGFLLMSASRFSSCTLTLTSEPRPGHFTLTCGTMSYTIEFRPETDVMLGDLLRRLSSVLVGGRDSSAKLPSDELLQTLGTRLWRVLLSTTAPIDMREALE